MRGGGGGSGGGASERGRRIWAKRAADLGERGFEREGGVGGRRAAAVADERRGATSGVGEGKRAGLGGAGFGMRDSREGKEGGR